MFPISEHLRRLALEMEEPEGDVVFKKKRTPWIKPPRRNPSTSNKSNRSDYMQKYMKKYRDDEGKSYQKIPPKLKEFRKKQRQELKKEAGINLNREAEKWYQAFINSGPGKRAYKEMRKKFPDYNSGQHKKATEFLFDIFIPWLDKEEKKYRKGGELAEFRDEVAHRVKTKIRAGIT